MARIFATLAGLALLSLQSFGTSVHVRTTSGTPSILATSGKVSLKEGTTLPDNAVISTGDKESIVIYFDEPTRLMSVGPNSQVRIDSAKSLVKLERGEAVVRIRKSHTALEPIRVATMRGMTTVKYGDFIFNSLQQQVIAMSGDASYQQESKSGDATQIKPGHSLAFGAGTTPVISEIAPSANTLLLAKLEKVPFPVATAAQPIIRAAMSGGPIEPPGHSH